MTPAARLQASADILDRILAGEAAEKVLTTWARKNRYAGSGDRAAIRGIVFDAYRRKRSLGWLGGEETGRGLIIGKLRDQGTEVSSIFDGQGYGPVALSEDEKTAGVALKDAPAAVRLDVPDWLAETLIDDLGSEAEVILGVMRHRAPIFLRANLAKTDRVGLLDRLATEGIGAGSHALAETAVEVEGEPRNLTRLPSFEDGLFELQDAASQAVIERLKDHLAGARVLDYCAGGGGKSLAMAALGAKEVVAHDAEPGRMHDLPARAARGAVSIEIAHDPRGMFDVVLCDAPCSGSGAWRRQVDAKWTLTETRLKELCVIQQDILEKAKTLVQPGGTLAYVTCSMLKVENHVQVQSFLDANPGWDAELIEQLTPLQGGDGFFASILRAPSAT
ncbi:MAG: RsmB/NOP family class I SAM-dependent RNA methyltransferase [Boseongicola sp.]|nr:MAG: RsmB/NOP family class I SAM-dependent RNA methyltransferase [Boseongicola sp.]